MWVVTGAQRLEGYPIHSDQGSPVMTNTVFRTSPPAGAVTDGSPRRQTLVAMAAVILVVYVVLFAVGSDAAYDDDLATITNAYDQSLRAIQVASFVGMAFVGLLLFFGAALRNTLRAATPTWLADVSLLGFAGLAATFASWFVTDLALWKAVDVGDESAIRAVATVADAGFLPLMAAMIAAYAGTGLAGLRTGALPRWLSIASIVVGVMAPLGPLGFVGMLLLPLWILATALTVRLAPTA